MEQQVITWGTFLSYAPMSVRRPEKTVGTLKRSIGRVVTDKSQELDRAMEEGLIGYCRIPAYDGASPVELVYVVKPKVTTADTMAKGSRARVIKICNC